MRPVKKRTLPLDIQGSYEQDYGSYIKAEGFNECHDQWETFLDTARLSVEEVHAICYDWINNKATVNLSMDLAQAIVARQNDKLKGEKCQMK